MSYRKVFTASVLLFLFALSACGGSSQPAISSPTVKPTQKVSATSTTKVTKLPATNGSALLGSDISAFIGKYGQPNDHSDVKDGIDHFQRYPGENTDFLIVATDFTGSTSRAEDITVQAPNAGWSIEAGTEKCSTFFPSDAKYQRQVSLDGGYDKIYFSMSLASLFPASAFTDASGNQVKAGSFDAQYLVNSDQTISSCDIIIGMQQTQK